MTPGWWPYTAQAVIIQWGVNETKLNEQISKLRKERKLSQEAVADALDVSRQAVSKWETGQSYPGTENLLKLARLFQVSADGLIELSAAGSGAKRKRRLGGRQTIIAIAAAVAGLLFAHYSLSGPLSEGTPESSVPVTAAESGAGLPQEPADPTREVYLAFITLSKENVSASDEYQSRLTIYRGLRQMDWAKYGAYGEAGKDEETRMALLQWLAEQSTLSEDELAGLIRGMDNPGVDGAYSEPYALALGNALISYSQLFISNLAALNDEERARRTADLAVYGAAYEKLDAAEAAVESAIRSGTLSDAEYKWAAYLKNRCANPYGTTDVTPEADGDFVLVKDYIPGIVINLKYATEHNFTGQVIYPFTKAYLRYGTVKKLMKVQSDLSEQGYGLAIWDAYRPVTAQFKLWAVCPDPTYVANPNAGFSAHSKGNTVDVTLTDLKGNEVEMPSEFDDFSSLADRNYSDVSAKAAANAELLASVMTAGGFAGYSGEWWHYSDTTDYPVEKSFNP